MAKDLIGKYKILSKIGQGGMGAVYKAIHPTLKRTVILKQLILKGNESINERFKREARIMLDLRNERIVQVFDHFKEGASYFIAMEYVDGMSLDDLIEKKRYLSNEAAILIFIEVCKGLKHAHDKEIIHRDIKPANILISKEGEIKVADFGIATSREDTQVGLTREGSTLGSPAYMSPEQINDAKSVDKRADVYSMGVMLYKMVTGKLPFACNISPDTISKIEKGKYTSAKKMNPKINPDLLSIMKKAMHHKKNKRYKDLGQIISKLSKYVKKFRRKNDINQAIKAYMYGKGDLTKSIKSGGVGSIFGTLSKKVIPITVIVIIAGLLIYQSGLFFEFFMPGQYGAVQIKLNTNNLYGIKGSHNIKTEVLYKDKKKDEYKKKYNALLVFIKNNKDSKKNITNFVSNKLYLKSDTYRICLEIEGRRFESDIFIIPRANQKKTEKTKKAQIINVNQNLIRVPLKAYFRFSDAEKGSKLGGVNIKVLQSGTWQSWGNFIKNKGMYVSGREYTFQFEKSGYKKKTKKIFVEPGQSVLNLEVALVPQPAVLNINLNKNNFKILLNNSKTYFNCGKINKYTKIQPSLFDKMGKGEKEKKSDDINVLNVSPGKYFLTIQKSKSVSKTVELYLKPNSVKNITVNYDKKTKTISLGIK